MIEKEVLEYPEVKPLAGQAKKLVVFLHGVGSDGNDLIGLVPFINKELPDCHFISPHGVEKYDMAPFGRQWFSLIDRTPETIGRLITENTPMLMDIIKKKQEELGLDNSQTIIWGFSQGTMMGVYLTLIQEKPFAATIACSGRLFPPDVSFNKSTPICLIHGMDDDVVSADESNLMADYFAENKIEHKKLLIPNLAHSIDASGIKFAIEFIKGKR